MFCRYCGSHIPDDSLFCAKCGKRLGPREIPIELSARIEPLKRADVEADFLGRKLLILQQGHTLPLTVVLAGELLPGAKKRILLNGSIMAEPPFKVTYEVREEDRQHVLT